MYSDYFIKYWYQIRETYEFNEGMNKPEDYNHDEHWAVM